LQTAATRRLDRIKIVHAGPLNEILGFDIFKTVIMQKAKSSVPGAAPSVA
jgi:hypothetical protein